MNTQTKDLYCTNCGEMYGANNRCANCGKLNESALNTLPNQMAAPPNMYNAAPSPIQVPYYPSPQPQGTAFNKNTILKYISIVSIVLSAVMLVFIGNSYYKFYSVLKMNNGLENDINAAKTTITELNKTIEENDAKISAALRVLEENVNSMDASKDLKATISKQRNELNYYNSKIAFMAGTDYTYYHTIECPQIANQRIIAYDINYIKISHKPCPVCHK